jgi:hypothetical protein
MVRAFEFQPRRAFSPYCAMVIGRWGYSIWHSLQRFRVLLSYAYHNMEMWLALVSASFSKEAHPIYFHWEGRISPIF